MATCWNSSLQSSFQLCFICFVRYIWIYVFCLNDLLFHDFSQHFVQKISQQACSMPLSGIHFHIHLFYPFILMPYGIMGDLRSEQEEKRFTYCYTKMKKLRISWLILAPKISLAFTFICKAFSHKIWSILIRRHPLVESVTKIVIKRVDVFLPQKKPHFLKESFLRQSFTKTLSPVLLLLISVLCRDEI